MSIVIQYTQLSNRVYRIILSLLLYACSFLFITRLYLHYLHHYCQCVYCYVCFECYLHILLFAPLPYIHSTLFSSSNLCSVSYLHLYLCHCVDGDDDEALLDPATLEDYAQTHIRRRRKQYVIQYTIPYVHYHILHLT